MLRGVRPCDQASSAATAYTGWAANIRAGAESTASIRTQCHFHRRTSVFTKLARDLLKTVLVKGYSSLARLGTDNADIECPVCNRGRSVRFATGRLQCDSNALKRSTRWILNNPCYCYVQITRLKAQCRDQDSWARDEPCRRPWPMAKSTHLTVALLNVIEDVWVERARLRLPSTKPVLDDGCLLFSIVGPPWLAGDIRIRRTSMEALVQH
jgi:hypothetical protein